MTDPRENGAEATNGGGDVDDIDDALPDDVSAAADFDDDLDVDDSTDAEDEVEPVELLVQLAEEGEIEPWDIDIVAVTDAFLERLDATDLRTSGRALFYASVLLRMKGDELLSPDEADEEPELEPWEMAMRGDDPAFDDDGDAAANGFDPVDALEAEMDRRLERKRARGSPETLDELVRELRDAERGTWWKESREYDTTNSPKGFRRGTQTLDYHSADDFRRDGEPGEADVTGTTHNEDIEATIEQVEATLATHYGEGRAEVLFAEIRDAGGRAFQTFLALLFLAHRGQIRLEQDELFGDLWVQDPTAVESAGDESEEDEDEVEAIAD
ncbi:segregation and condensation protein A [Halogranum rubrum]|uniref:Chromosome segregation and condensation protein ScpA n=1 Tax=Halogranum salarium B-1 TaxID=1210908 RepID=J3JH66_9EURY|nr:ScpA family protein [Halogranum salarium]EJN60724.1 chromosome segregation and condensation protein ScpA [Halogranum salarium B-1]